MKNIFKELSSAELIGNYRIPAAHLGMVSEMGMYALSMPAYAKQPAHYHRQGDDVFVVLSGEGELLLADLDHDHQPLSPRIFKLNPGDTYFVPPQTVHAIHNLSDQPFVFLNLAPESHVADDVVFVKL